jgi:hypothetical protein
MILLIVGKSVSHNQDIIAQNVTTIAIKMACESKHYTNYKDNNGFNHGTWLY